jgi:glycosyltransferase involved in cell wall biosynthesis
VRVLVPADIRFPLERANGVQVLKTAAALARGGVPTTLLVRQSDPRPTEAILALYGIEPHPDFEVDRIGVLHRRGARLIPRASFLLRAAAASVASLRKGSLVYTRDLQLADLLLALPLSPGGVVYEAHAVEREMYGERGILYGTKERPEASKLRRIGAREARVWRRASAVVTTTRGIRDSLEAEHGGRENVLVLPNGCDLVPGRAFTPPAEGARILYAGQLYPWKGVDVLVEAVARIPEARLVILGGIEAEPDLARIRALVEARGIAPRTEMPGTVPQARVAEEIARAAVVVVPFLRTTMTERHTSPLKVFEAMAAGRPIVATDLPASREVLEDGTDALLVPPGDPAALASALTRILADRQLGTRLARAAFDKAPGYSWDSRAARLRELFERLPVAAAGRRQEA